MALHPLLKLYSYLAIRDWEDSALRMSRTVVYSILSIFFWLSAPGSVIIASGQGQLTDVQVLERGDDWQCPSIEERERARNKIHQIVASAIATTFSTTTPDSTTTTTMSSTTTSATTMSTMTGMHSCNGTPGWRRVAFINMTDTSYNCPTGLSLTSYSKRTCGRSHTGAGCSSTTFSVGGLPYSRVCGRMRGYQFGPTDAFFYYTQGIDSYYVEGVSLTHGGVGRRQHIWTFAAGVSEVSNDLPNHSCPCDTGNYDRVPAFVGNFFFCESGFHSAWNVQSVLFPNDVLWDGQDCIANSTCCQFNNPPWFTKNLSTATTDDIELRICININGDVPFELIELYVQ